MSNKKLFEQESSEDENENSLGKITVNKSYAEKYEKWKREEDYQKLKAKYGSKAIASDSESSSDEEFVEPDNPEFDMDFFRVLAAIRLKHPILDKEKKFFRDSYQLTKKNENKPMTVADYERKLILETGGQFEDEDQQRLGCSKIVKEHLPNLEEKFKFDDNLSDNGDDDDSLFVKKKVQNEEDATKNDAVEFLKGNTAKLSNKLDEELLNGLKKDWNTAMSEEDKYLMDYFVNQRYLDEENEAAEREPNHYVLDVESLEEDEETFNKMEEYESKYRFRFEEPDEEFIRRHPRVIKDSMRNKDTKRKDERVKKKDKELAGEESRKQELLRLKAFKKKEILERIQMLQEAAGKLTMDFKEFDLNEDFDPDQHDAAMSKMFDEDYYQEDIGHEKPKFQDDEINREIEEEYEKLKDLEYMLEGNYKYVDVCPNSYGLSTEEILCAKDTELNQWYSMKRMLRFGKTEEIEKRDQKNFTYRASLEHIKRKIMPSLFTDDIEDQWKAEEERKRKRNLKKKIRKLNKMNNPQNENIAAAATCSKQESAPNHCNQEQTNSAQNHEMMSLSKTSAITKKSRLKSTADGLGGAHHKKNKEKSKATMKLSHREEDTIVGHPSKLKKQNEGGEACARLESKIESVSVHSEGPIQKKEHRLKKSKAKRAVANEEETSIIAKVNNERRLGVLDSSNVCYKTSLKSDESNHRQFEKKKRKRNDSGVSKLSKKRKQNLERGKCTGSQKKAESENKLQGISDARLVAYGQNPKKFKRLMKYTNKLK